jgi:hypothetical protein
VASLGAPSSGQEQTGRPAPRLVRKKSNLNPRGITIRVAGTLEEPDLNISDPCALLGLEGAHAVNQTAACLNLDSRLMFTDDTGENRSRGRLAIHGKAPRRSTTSAS